MTIVVGPRTLPAFRSIGILGYHVAFAAAVLAAIRTEFSLVVTVGLSATAALSFLGWGVVRRAITGVESLVLLEHLWVAIAAVAGYLALIGEPVLEGLDVLTIGLALFLAFGRIGCLTVGCCHGTPVTTGIRYGPDHDHLPPWLVGRRLRPVPLLEAVGLLVIFVVGLALLGGRPGTATVWFLAAYAVLRFGTESLRGDRRPHVGPVSVARVMATIQLGAAIWLWHYVVTGEVATVPGKNGGWGLAATLTPVAVAVAAGGMLTVNRWRASNPLTDPAHLDECWRIVARSAATCRAGDTDPVMHTTSRAVDIGVTVPGPARVHASFHHPRCDTDGLACVLGGGEVVSRNGISHTILWTPTPGFEAEPGDHDGPHSNGWGLGNLDAVDRPAKTQQRSDGYFPSPIGS